MITVKVPYRLTKVYIKAVWQKQGINNNIIETLLMGGGLDEVNKRWRDFFPVINSVKLISHLTQAHNTPAFSSPPALSVAPSAKE